MDQQDTGSDPDVVVVGAACLDIKGRLDQAFVAGTSNSGSVRLSVGGCARNIAENVARLGLPVALLTAVCQDDFGRTIIRQSQQAGVNTEHVLVSCDHHSAAYIALLNPNGQLLVGIDDTRSINAITPAYIAEHAELLANARMVMMDANVPLDAAEALLRICDDAGVEVGFDPVAFAPAIRYRSLLHRFAFVTPNVIEAQALTGLPIGTVDQARVAAKKLVSIGSDIAIITMADQGVVYATSETSGHVPAIKIDIVDATGASDALTATLIYGLLNDFAVDESVRLGASAAALTLGSTDTVRQDLTLEHLYAQLVL